jgi:uncharacterized membrane protein HdeD (DUF308 family)
MGHLNQSWAGRSRSGPMSAALARNWWAVGIRALSAAVLALSIAVLPRHSVAGLAVMLAVYIGVDGAFAIVAGMRAARRDERWPMLFFEGTTNLLLASVILSWPAIAVAPLINLLSAWAIVTGALMLGAARRLVPSHGRWALVGSGIVSVAWGMAAAAVGPSSATDPIAVVRWLLAYSVPFGVALLAFAILLQQQQRG